MLKECEDCGCIFNAYSSQEKRCKICQEKFRSDYEKSYHKRYKSDKPKSAISGQYYQYWKFAETLSDEELQSLYQVRRQKLKYTSDWNERQEIKTQMKILCDIYKARIGDRTLKLTEIGMEDDYDRYYKEMIDNE